MSAKGQPGPFNKAVMPLGNTGIISHILERFPTETRIVVAVGYLAEQVENYLSLMHPERNITCVQVENYAGEGSGPGLSLLTCQPHLNEPFFMVPADTLFTANAATLPHTQAGHNWVGVGTVAASETASYTTVGTTEGGRITAIAHKEHKPGWQAFNGLMYIHDHAAFFTALANPQQRAGEHHITNGLLGLLEGSGVYAQEMAWQDVGTHELLAKANAQYGDYDFSKTDEALYFTPTHVVKMFINPTITANRVKKAALNPAAFPPIDGHKGQFYRYPLQPGEVLYKQITLPMFRQLLGFCEDNLWKKVTAPATEMAALCHDFYHTKTMERVKKYHQKYPTATPLTQVNGEAVVSAESLLERLDWNRLCQGIPSFMHGDLQFDNILFDTQTQRFTLLDWRQDFGGKVEYGDLYYDLAKLNGGITLHYDLIKKNLFLLNEHGSEVWIDFAQRASAESIREAFFAFCTEHGYDIGKVQLLTAIIFLNMAPLHHAPFDRLLYALSTRELTRLSHAAATAAWFSGPAEALRQAA